MPRIAPTPIQTLHPLTITVTADKAQQRILTSDTEKLVAETIDPVVSTTAESVEAQELLRRVQQMQRWVSGIFRTAKAPLTAAKKTLDAEEQALTAPLRDAQARLQAAILAFQTTAHADRMRADAQRLEARLLARPEGSPRPDAPVSLVPRMQCRSTYGADVLDFQQLLLAVAGQILLQKPGMTAVTRRWITAVCHPTPQATIDLLEPGTTALHRLARALKSDLAIPGVAISVSTSLVSR